MKDNQNIPVKHHVARYCKPRHVDDGVILRGAFRPRPHESYISVNWLEYFGEELEISQQIKFVRKTMPLKPSSNGRFVRLNVGKVQNAIKKQIKHIPIPEENNFSHASICYSADEDENGQLSADLASLVQPDDIFPAL